MASEHVVIDGRFELRGRLGSGGMGTVWRAFDLALQREVALKEVRFAGGDAANESPDLARKRRERVMREARALARIDHPNVVTIHHIVDTPEQPHPWLVMELVRGQSLQERLADGLMPPGEAAVVGRGILAALNAAHAAGIRHRDVKPANVLLRADGTPVLTDFGIAVLEDASRVTATGGLVGSPEYIAPERLHGQEGDPASDLWSLGMLLYVAVEGRSPLRRATTAATLAAVMTAPIPPAQHAGPLEPVLQALLNRNPATRPTAPQLEQMLNRAAAAPPSSNLAPPRPPAYQGPGQSSTSGWLPPPPTGPLPQRRRRRSPVLPIALSVAGTSFMVMMLVAAIIILPRAFQTGEGAEGAEEPVGTGSASPSRSGSAEPKTLLTSAAIRDVIKKFQQASGSKAFAELTVYEERADADAPVPGRRGAFDNYTFQKGADAAIRGRPSIAITTGDAKVDPSIFKWEALPTLMRRAARTLKVPKPTSKYIIVRASWAFNGDQPVMMIYYSDEYDGGYLAVNTKGQVVSTVPADS